MTIKARDGEEMKKEEVKWKSFEIASGNKGKIKKKWVSESEHKRDGTVAKRKKKKESFYLLIKVQ